MLIGDNEGVNNVLYYTLVNVNDLIDCIAKARNK